MSGGGGRGSGRTGPFVFHSWWSALLALRAGASLMLIRWCPDSRQRPAPFTALGAAKAASDRGIFASGHPRPQRDDILSSRWWVRHTRAQTCPASPAFFRALGLYLKTHQKHASLQGPSPIHCFIHSLTDGATPSTHIRYARH